MNQRNGPPTPVRGFHSMLKNDAQAKIHFSSQDLRHSPKMKDKWFISLLRFCSFCLFSLSPFLSDCDIFLSHLSFFYRIGLTILIPSTTLLPAETCATSEKLFNLLLKRSIDRTVYPWSQILNCFAFSHAFQKTSKCQI